MIQSAQSKRFKKNLMLFSALIFGGLLQGLLVLALTANWTGEEKVQDSVSYVITAQNS